MFVYSCSSDDKYDFDIKHVRYAVVKSSALCWTGTQSNPAGLARGTIWYLPRYSILLALSGPRDTKTSLHTHACVRMRAIYQYTFMCYVCVYTYIRCLFGCAEKKGKKIIRREIIKFGTNCSCWCCFCIWPHTFKKVVMAVWWLRRGLLQQYTAGNNNVYFFLLFGGYATRSKKKKEY